MDLPLFFDSNDGAANEGCERIFDVVSLNEGFVVCGLVSTRNNPPVVFCGESDEMAVRSKDRDFHKSGLMAVVGRCEATSFTLRCVNKWGKKYLRWGA